MVWASERHARSHSVRWLEIHARITAVATWVDERNWAFHYLQDCHISRGTNLEGFPGGAHCPFGQGRAEPVAGRDLAADGGVAGGLRRLAEARSVGAAIRVCLGGRGLPAGPNGRQTPNACWC